MREKIEVLENHSDLRSDGFDILQIADQFGPLTMNATLLMRFKTIDAADQRRLSRTGRSADHVDTEIH